MGRFFSVFFISVFLSHSVAAKINQSPALVILTQPTSCINGTFSSTGDQWWQNIILKLTNNCGKLVDLQNTTVTFINKIALNTNFWGEFNPLPYPDNNLIITSQPQLDGTFLSTFKMHFPTYPGSTTLLPVGSSISIRYGAPHTDFVIGSVNVSLNDQEDKGDIQLINTTEHPVDVKENYVLVHITSNSQKVSDIQLQWGGKQALLGLPVGTYNIAVDNITGTSGNVYQGTVTPSSVKVSTNQTIQVNINYSTAQIDINRIRLSYNLPALGGLKMQNNVSQLYISGYRKWGVSTLTTNADQFHLGSCTKAMTATLIAIFVERKLISWDDTLDKLFPELSSTTNPAFKSVTLGMLTSHMSGIGVNSYNNNILWATISNPNLDPVAGRKYLTKVVLSAPPDYTPGQTYFYNNYNYVIAAAALENRTGFSWEYLITAEIFNPLLMSSCGFGPPGNQQSIPPDQPWGHCTDTNHRPIPAFYDNPETIGPSATVHCSMSDWAKFGQLHLNGFNNIDTPILKASSFIKLQTPYPGQSYTYGGWIKYTSDWGGGATFWHNGSNTLNYAQIWLAPLKNTLILSVTNIAYNGDAATNEVFKALSNSTFFNPGLAE